MCDRVVIYRLCLYDFRGRYCINIVGIVLRDCFVWVWGLLVDVAESVRILVLCGR